MSDAWQCAAHLAPHACVLCLLLPYVAGVCANSTGDRPVFACVGTLGGDYLTVRSARPGWDTALSVVGNQLGSKQLQVR
jgi:hypothetical protein